MKRCLLLLCLLLFLTACQPATVTIEPTLTPEPPTETAEPPLPTATQTQPPSMTPTNGNGYPCPKTSDEQAMQAVRILLNQPELELTFRGAENALYNHTHHLAIFEDNQINEYKVDCSSALVVEIVRHTGFDPRTPQPTPEALEQVAQDLIRRGAPDLDLSQLKASPGSKDGNRFFRWEGDQVLTDPPGGMKAFVQVGLSTNGVILSYLNLFPLVTNEP